MWKILKLYRNSKGSFYCVCMHSRVIKAVTFESFQKKILNLVIFVTIKMSINKVFIMVELWLNCNFYLKFSKI